MSSELERWLETRTLNPIRELSQIQESFDRLFNEFTNLKRSNEYSDISFSPSCEVAEEGNSYMLKFDLPGVHKDQVSVEIEKNRLTVKAERKEEKKSETQKKYLSEVYYGSYTRSFALPGPVDEKKIDAKFEDGVLTVKIPKSESSNMKQIPIH